MSQCRVIDVKNSVCKKMECIKLDEIIITSIINASNDHIWRHIIRFLNYMSCGICIEWLQTSLHYV